MIDKAGLQKETWWNFSVAPYLFVCLTATIIFSL